MQGGRQHSSGEDDLIAIIPTCCAVVAGVRNLIQVFLEACQRSSISANPSFRPPCKSPATRVAVAESERVTIGEGPERQTFPSALQMC